MESLSYADLKDEIHKRLDGTVSRADISSVLGALKDEVVDCVTSGYKVGIPSLVSFQPRYIAAKPRRKGTNPFDPDAGEQTFPAKPAKFLTKAKASSAINKHYPSVKSKAGQTLTAELAPPAPKAKAPAKKAAAKKGSDKQTGAKKSAKGKGKR